MAYNSPFNPTLVSCGRSVISVILIDQYFFIAGIVEPTNMDMLLQKEAGKLHKSCI